MSSSPLSPLSPTQSLSQAFAAPLLPITTSIKKAPSQSSNSTSYQTNAHTSSIAQTTLLGQSTAAAAYIATHSLNQLNFNDWFNEWNSKDWKFMLSHSSTTSLSNETPVQKQISLSNNSQLFLKDYTNSNVKVLEDQTNRSFKLKINGVTIEKSWGFSTVKKIRMIIYLNEERQLCIYILPEGGKETIVDVLSSSTSRVTQWNLTYATQKLTAIESQSTQSIATSTSSPNSLKLIQSSYNPNTATILVDK